jgi:glycosyltransferase involved in cell wall biosynthesis
MDIVIREYPFNKDCALALTIDDLHPEAANDLEKLDFGYNFTGTFWKRINKLTSQFPEIKITLFAVANWIDRSDLPAGIFWPLRKLYRKKRQYPVNTFNISLTKYADWIDTLNLKVKNNQIKIALHGLYHYQKEKGYPTSQEFAGQSEAIIENKFKTMENIFKKSGLIFVKGFRSPGWGINDFLINQLKKRKYLYTASSSDFYSDVKKNKSNKSGLKNQNLYTPTFLSDSLINFTANCFPGQYKRAVEIAKNNGIILIHAHIASTVFGLKYVDKSFPANIAKIILEVQRQTLKDIWFTYLAEIAEFVYAKKQLKYKFKDRSTIEFENPSKYSLKGLTVVCKNKTYVIDEILPGKKHLLKLTPFDRTKPKVSIILTVFNGARSVVESLDSLAKQTYQNIEIIVVNDGSTDNTKQLVENYIKSSKDNRIALINQKNQGRARARNNGFLQSKGEIITFCEDDALYEKHYIENGAAHFFKKDYLLGGVIGPHYVWNKIESVNTRVKDLERRRNFYNYNPQSSWFYSRDVFEKIGMFDNRYELVEDVIPAILLAKKGYHFIYEPKCRWLHREPAKYFNYLRRKFRGGVGMVVLEKRKMKKIVSPKLLVLLAAAIVLFLASIILKPLLLLLLLPLGPCLLILVRVRDIVKGIIVSDESLPFILLSVLWEYTWWGATFLGYLYGKTMSIEKINSYLKGR